MAGLLCAIEEKLTNIDSEQILFHARIETSTALTQASFTSSARKSDPNSTRRDRYNEKQARVRQTRASIKDRMVLSLRERAEELHTEVPLIYPVWAMCLFFYKEDIFYNELTKMVSKRPPALIKLIDFAAGSMVKANIIHSAKLIQSHDGSRRLVGDKNMVEIFLMKYDPETNRKKFTGTALSPEV